MLELSSTPRFRLVCNWSLAPLRYAYNSLFIFISQQFNCFIPVFGLWKIFFSGPFSLKGLSFRPGSADLMLLQTFLCKLLVLWPHLLLSVVLAVSGLGDGRGGMSTFFVYGLVVRGVCVCVHVL